MAPSAPTSPPSPRTITNTRTTKKKLFSTTRPRRRWLKATARTGRHVSNNKKQNLHPSPPSSQAASPEISKIPEVSEDPPSSYSSSEAITADEPLSSSSSCCSTPKGHKFRIPEIATCPPAPKKKKPVSLLSGNCSRRRSPISFFAPPDLELFFFLALPDNISA